MALGCGKLAVKRSCASTDTRCLPRDGSDAWKGVATGPVHFGALFSPWSSSERNEEQSTSPESHLTPPILKL